MVKGEPWSMAAGTETVIEYDISLMPGIAADRQVSDAAVLLEVALQLLRLAGCLHGIGLTQR